MSISYDRAEMTPAEEAIVRHYATRRKYADIRRLGADALHAQIQRDANQAHMAAFVLEHGIACFKCKSRLSDWASTGTGEFGSKWAICVRCVRGPR